MGFEAVAKKVESQPYMIRPKGESNGIRVNQYFRRETYERLQAKCRARGISVSRYLMTLAEESIAEDER